jgi:hypothetical protein
VHWVQTAVIIAAAGGEASNLKVDIWTICGVVHIVTPVCGGTLKVDINLFAWHWTGVEMVTVHIGLSEIKGPKAPKPDDHRA